MIRLQWRTLLHCRQAGKELENKQKNIPSQDPSIRHVGVVTVPVVLQQPGRSAAASGT